VTPKRGDRVAPPSRPDEYELRFATNDAAKGWDELCQQAAANTRAAYDIIRATPCPSPANERHHRLKHDLAWGTHRGKSFEQWQYEVTSGGRIWYLVDHETRTVWLNYASTRHPKTTDKG
jgi:hypothetical protein